jgi:hypothetical protein
MRINDFFRGMRSDSILAVAAGPEPAQSHGRNWIILFASMILSAWVAVSLGQDVSWDVQNYHYYTGYAYLHKPMFYDFGPAQVQSFFNPLLHVLSYLLLAHLHSRMAATILGAIQGLNFFFLFQISMALFRRWQDPYRQLLSLGNAAAGFYGVVNMMELGATYGDNMVSILTLAGMLLLVRRLMSDRTVGRGANLALWIGGASIGVAFALKLTVIVYVAAIGLSAAFVLPAVTKRLQPLMAFYGGLLVGFIAAYGAWGIKLYREYQNPVYPYLNNIFRSPFYDLLNAMDARFMPRNWRETFFYPFFFAHKNHLASELEFRDPRFACCYVAILLLAGCAVFRLVRRARSRPVTDAAHRENWCLLLFTLFMVVSYASWQLIFSVYRYLSVLELLAPTFIALALSYLFRSRALTLVLSLLVSLAICWTVIPIDYGRQKFDDSFLQVEVPPIPDLDRSVVMMVGDEPTSYIIPRFPASTRFVRVSSNFFFPGRNAKLDRQIRDILAQYDITKTLVYVANAEEIDTARATISYFGIALEDQPCREINSRTGNKGYLCGASPAPKPGESGPTTRAANVPKFRDVDGVKLEVTPGEAIAGKDSLQYRVVGLPVRAIDMLFTIDDQPMPAVRNWVLDAQQTARIFVSTTTRKGLYHITGIRNSDDADRTTWIRVDISVRIR